MINRFNLYFTSEIGYVQSIIIFSLILCHIANQSWYKCVYVYLCRSERESGKKRKKNDEQRNLVGTWGRLSSWEHHCLLIFDKPVGWCKLCVCVFVCTYVPLSKNTNTTVEKSLINDLYRDTMGWLVATGNHMCAIQVKCKKETEDGGRRWWRWWRWWKRRQKKWVYAITCKQYRRSVFVFILFTFIRHRLYQRRAFLPHQKQIIIDDKRWELICTASTIVILPICYFLQLNCYTIYLNWIKYFKQSALAI